MASTISTRGIATKGNAVTTGAVSGGAREVDAQDDFTAGAASPDEGTAVLRTDVSAHTLRRIIERLRARA